MQIGYACTRVSEWREETAMCWFQYLFLNSNVHLSALCFRSSSSSFVSFVPLSPESFRVYLWSTINTLFTSARYPNRYSHAQRFHLYSKWAFRFMCDNLLKMSIRKHVLVTKLTEITYHISQHT